MRPHTHWIDMEACCRNQCWPQLSRLKDRQTHEWMGEWTMCETFRGGWEEGVCTWARKGNTTIIPGSYCSCPSTGLNKKIQKLPESNRWRETGRTTPEKSRTPNRRDVQYHTSITLKFYSTLSLGY